MFKEWSDALLQVSNVPPGSPPPAGFDEALAAERAFSGPAMKSCAATRAPTL